MIQSLLADTKIIRVSNGAAAGTSAVTSSVVDMQGYQGICFIASLGTVVDASVLTLTVNENTANSTSSPTPVAVTGGATQAFTASTSSNTDLIVDVVRPKDRYVYCVLTRTAQNATVNAIYAILYKANTRPVTQTTNILASASSSPEA